MRLTRATPRAFQAALELGCQSEACAPPNKKGTGGTGGSIKGDTKPRGGPKQPVDKYGFPTRECIRCHGSGKHSFNTRDRDTCFGCRGAGIQRTPKGQKAYVKWAEAQRNASEPLVKDIAVGDMISLEVGRVKQRTYQKLIGMEVTSKPTGTKDGVPWAFETHLTLEDGSTKTLAGNQYVRRNLRVDPAPFAAEALPKSPTPRIVKTKSIPNVDDARLLDSLRQTHELIHTPKGIQAWSQTRRSMIDMGRRGLKIRNELTKRGVKTGIDCRFCGSQPGLTHNH